MSPTRRKVLRNAEVEPLDLDGVRSVLTGSALWAVALVYVLVRYQSLSDSGQGWWLATALAGLGLGMIGLVYCLRRRSRVRQGRSADRTEGLLQRRKST